MNVSEIYQYDMIHYSKIIEYLAIIIVVVIVYFKIPKSKSAECDDKSKREKNKHGKGKEKDEDKEDDLDSITELRFTSSKNTYDIHNLQIENYELRNKLDKIYSNDLTENINYYKNIISMNEKIEYMQKIVLRTSEINDKFDRFTQYVESKFMNLYPHHSADKKYNL
jgi:hypothetical protein